METKGVTCKIPLDLHNRISEEIRETESTIPIIRGCTASGLCGMCGRTSMPVTWAALSNRRKI